MYTKDMNNTSAPFNPNTHSTFAGPTGVAFSDGKNFTVGNTARCQPRGSATFFGEVVSVDGDTFTVEAFGSRDRFTF